MSGEDEKRIADRRAASHMNEDGKEDQAAAANAGESTDAPSNATPEARLAEEQEKAERYYKNWQRAAADLANYKRRVEQERSEQARLANAALVINLLPIVDDMDRAIATLDSTLAGLNWAQGMVAIHRKLQQLLESMGVQEIAAEGEPFDPAVHEAVGRQPGEENRVLHVVQKGYRLGDRVVRPAMVIVGTGQTEAGDAGGSAT
ncbi:MAG: nucleotide exchange factor GrpE [Dehalococcoidia bacterium]